MITRYRYASVEYFKHVLCDEVEHPDLSEFSEELQSALRCWDEIADHIRQVCSKRTSCALLLSFCLILTIAEAVTRKILLAAMIDYMWSVDYVDSIYSDDKMPSLQQYWCRRERTAGVHPVIATIPYVYMNNCVE